jgi:tubulin-specific chaperone A
MPAPSELSIATKAVQRLVKEEGYHRSELVKQEARVKKLEEDIKAGGPDLDDNAEYVLKQEVSGGAVPRSRHP